MQYSLFSFARLFPHSSWAAAILFILFHIALYSFTWYRGTTIIIVSLQVIKGMRQDAERIAFRIRLLGSLLNATVGVSHIITLLGTILAPTLDEKIRFYYAYYAVSVVYQLAWLISVLKYYSAFIATMEDHMDRGKRLGTPASSDSNLALEETVAKLRRLRVTFIGSVGVQTILSIICIILPPIGSYYIPVWQTTGSFAVLSLLRELRQQELAEKPSQATSAGSTDTVSSAQSSTARTNSTVSGSAEPLLDD